MLGSTPLSFVQMGEDGKSPDGASSGRVFGGLLARATFTSAEGGGVRRLDKDSAPAAAGTSRAAAGAADGNGAPKKIQLAAGYSQMDWMRLTKREPDLAGRNGASRKRKISMEEVATHGTEEDGWTVFKGKVYNLTPYLDFHPGGRKILKAVIGKDCTAQFNKYHAWVNGEYMMEKCQVGVLDTYVPGSDSEDESEEEDDEGFSFRM